MRTFEQNKEHAEDLYINRQSNFNDCQHDCIASCVLCDVGNKNQSLKDLIS